MVDPQGPATGSAELTAYDATSPEGLELEPSAEGDTKTFSVGVPGEVPAISFEGTEGEKILLEISGVSFPSGWVAVAAPSGSPRWRGNEGPLWETEGVSEALELDLPATGTYWIYFLADGGHTGSATFTARTAPADLTGSIPAPTPEGVQESVSLARGQDARYSVPVDAGENVTIESQGSFSGAYELRWLDHEGQQLGSTSCGAEGACFLTHAFGQAGTYTLVVDPQGPATGSAELTAYDATSPEGLELEPSAEGDTKTFSVGVPGEVPAISFEGTEGEKILLEISGVSFPSGWVAVAAPSGSPRWRGNEGPLWETEGVSEALELDLPATGTYWIYFLADGGHTGSATFTARTAPADLTGSIPAPTPEGVQESVSLARGQDARYSVPVDAGENVTIESQGSFSGAYELRWLDHEGQQLGSTSCGAEGACFLTHAFGQAGTYTLVVDPQGPATGSAELTAYDATSPEGLELEPSAEGDTKTFSVGVPGEVPAISFEGTEGERIQIDANEISFGSGWIAVHAPSGEIPASENREGPLSRGSTKHLEFILPASGTYTIYFLANDDQTGSLKLTARTAATPEEPTGTLGTITPLATPEGAFQHVAIGTADRKARYSVEMTAGERVALKTTESAFDGRYYIRWLEPSGSVLYSEWWNGAENWFWSPKTFAEAGTYTLEVEPQGTATGSVDLKLWEDPTLTGQQLHASPEGDSVTSTIEVPGEAEAITFIGEVDQSVEITTTESTFEEGEVTLLSPEGDALQSTFISGSIQAQLPDSGTYTILVEGGRDSTGSVVVELRDSSTSEEITGQINPTTAGAEQHVEFTSPGQVARYTVPVTAGESVSMASSATALGADYRLEWLSLSGEAVQTWYPSGEADRFFEAVRFGETGDATLVLTPEEGATGSVDLALFDASDETGQITLGEAATFSIAAPGQRDLIELEGTEGERLNLIPSEAAFEGEFHLETPAGELLEGSGGDLTAAHGPVTLPEPGTYEIVLTGNEAQTGSVGLEAELSLVPACSDASATTEIDEALTVEAGNFECLGAGPFEYEAISSPAHGAISDFDAEDASFVYTPDPGFVGEDSFTIHAGNEFGFGNAATFLLEVEPSANPVAAYSFDEGEGSIAHDAVGDHDGTIDGAEWVEGGRFGGALRFDAGDEDSVEIPAGPDFDLTDGLTLEAWVKPEAERAWTPIIAKESATSQAYALYGAGPETSTPTGFVTGDDAESAEVSSEGALEAGQWSYLTLTSDGEDLRLYVNGELVGTNPARAARLTNGSLRIGGQGSLSHYFDGLIDEVRIYNRPLGAEEIAENMESAVIVSATKSPEIWGRAMVGESLSAVEGEWSSISTVDREVAWMRCDASGESCEPIEGESSRSHEVTADDVGHTFRVKVTAKSEGFEDTAVSPPTDPVVVADAPEANGSPLLLNPLDNPPAPLVPGTTISIDERPAGWYPFHASTFNWFGYTPSGVVLQWQRCDASGAACADIEGAELSTYYVTDADVGSTLRLVSSAENSQGSASTTSEPSSVIHALAKPVAPSSPEAPEAWPQPPREKDTLTAPSQLWGNGSGELSQYGVAGRTYQWSRCDAEGGNCSAIPTANDPTYLLADGDVGHTFRVQIIAANATGEASMTTPPSETIREYVSESPGDFPFTVNLGAQQPLMGYEISVGYSNWIHHGQGPETVKRQWLRCNLEGQSCQPIPGASDHWYTPTGIDLGHTLRARIKITDEGGVGQATSAASSPVRISPDPKLVGSPTVRVRATGKVLTEGPPVGMELFAEDAGVWSRSALDYASPIRWQWQRCSAEGTECEDIAGAWLTESTSYYVPRERDVGYRLRVKVVKAGPKGDYAATSNPTAIVAPGRPRNLALPSVLGVAREGESFTASEGAWTDTEPWIAYQWLRCDSGGGSCIEIDGAQDRDYLSTAGDEGETLRVDVTASNAAGESSAISEPTAVLGPGRAPELSSLPTVEGSAVVDEPLTGSFGDWDGARPLEFEGQWLRCDAEGESCTPILGAIESNRPVKEADLGHTLRFEVTAINHAGSATARSTATALVAEPPAPVNAVPPSFEGEANVGATLSADEGKWSPPAAWYGYQWQVCDAAGEGCVDVKEATEPTFLVPKSAEGMRANLLVTGHTRGGEETAESGVGGVIGAMLTPVNVGQPWFRDAARESRPLKPELGIWEGGRPMTFTYQWLHCDSSGNECADILGAVAEAYAPTAEDVGLRVKVEVTATNESGSATAISSRSTEVQKSEPWFAGDVEIDGQPTEGVEASVDIAALRGSKPMEVDYQWERCFDNCITIPGATAQSYTPGAEDVAHRLRVKVTARNSVSDSYEATEVSLYSAPVEPAETGGAPRIAEYPMLAGWPRATQTLTATEGTWRGAGEVATSTRWQRCGGDVATCQDIEGATGDTYELEPADVGSRIRAVVSASNGLGDAEAGSRLTPPILPAYDTVITLETEEAGISVEELLEAVQEAEVPVVGLEYTGARAGAYSGGVAGTEAQDVLASIAARHDPADLVVTRFTLSGDFTGRFASNTVHGSMLFGFFDPIGSLIKTVLKSLDKIPSIRFPAELEQVEEITPGGQSKVSEKEPTERKRGEPGLQLPIIQSGEIDGFERNCPSECGNPEGSTELPPREVSASFRWALSKEELLAEYERKGYPLAFEFDMKLINERNTGSGKVGIPIDGCPSSETEDFWISDRDDFELESGIPTAAGPYFDTPVLDPCSRKDITVGVLHPEDLVKGRRYETNLSFFSSGESPQSGFEWHAELLERVGGCDTSAWCVNLAVPVELPFGIEIPLGRYRLPQVLIPPEYHWKFPHCYEYHYKAGRKGAGECGAGGTT